MEHTKLLVGVPAVVVLGGLDRRVVSLDGDGRLSGAGCVVVVDNVTGGRIFVLVFGAHGGGDVCWLFGWSDASK